MVRLEVSSKRDLSVVICETGLYVHYYRTDVCRESVHKNIGTVITYIRRPYAFAAAEDSQRKNRGGFQAQ